MEESISSKKKEKRKHVDHVESSVFVTPGAVRSSDDLEDDTGDYRVLSRYVMMPLPSSRPGDPARGSPLSGSDVRGRGGSPGWDRQQENRRFIQNSPGKLVICQTQKHGFVLILESGFPDPPRRYQTC